MLFGTCQAFCWCQQNENLYPELKFMYAIPNGGDRDIITAGKLKAEGVKAGVLDTFLPCARMGFHGLYIEFKKPGMETAKDGGLSKSQVAFGNFATAQGYKCALCYNWEQARDVIINYMRG